MAAASVACIKVFAGFRLGGSLALPVYVTVAETPSVAIRRRLVDPNGLADP